MNPALMQGAAPRLRPRPRLGPRLQPRRAVQNDLIAAVIVTIMLIPQSLAYALLAGLPPEAGLYASIAADHPLCDLRHLARAGRRAGRGGLADDRRRGGQVAEQGTAGYAIAALTLAVLSGGILLRWAC
jgi:SulP family sulfate permease